MIIRAYRDTDQDAVVQLWHLTGLTTPQNNPVMDIKRKQRVDPDLFLVATQERNRSEEVLGTIMGGYEGHRGWINYMGVRPDYQRRGIATLMIKEIESLLVKRGCPKINLQVRGSNSQAIEFYRALGYLDDKVVGLGKRLQHD